MSGTVVFHRTWTISPATSRATAPTTITPRIIHEDIDSSLAG